MSNAPTSPTTSRASSPSPVTEVRTIEWTAAGYEGAYTQYALVPAPLDGNPAYGYLFITQIATRDNAARALAPVEQEKEFGLLRVLREKVNAIIEQRVATDAIEI